MAKMTLGKVINKSFSKKPEIEAKKEEVIIEKEVIKEIIVEKPVEIIKEVIKKVPVTVDNDIIDLPNYDKEINILADEVSKLKQVDKKIMDGVNASLQEVEDLALSNSHNLQRRLHDLDVEIDSRIAVLENRVIKIEEDNKKLIKRLKIAGVITAVLLLTALII